MNKSKTRRHRHRRNKLSRRMKKRGGVPKVPKVPKSMNTSRSSKITGVKRVHMSSIVDQPLNKRPPFFEPFPPRPPIPYGRDHTILTQRGNKYTVNKSIYLEKKNEALVMFKDEFKNIQDRYISDLGHLGHLGPKHNGRWMFIKAGDTIWDPLTDLFTVYPKVVMSDRDNLSSLDDNQIGKAWLISEYNKTGIFCVPETYDLTKHTGLLPSEQFIPPVRQSYYWGQVD